MSAPLRATDDHAEPEQAGQAPSLARLAEGLAHDVKNALNAMALQLALLAEKLDEQAGGVVRSQLTALHAQITKVDELVRRFVDVAAPAGGRSVDLTTLLGDLAGLHAHAMRQRRLRLDLRRQPGAPISAIPARAVGLLLGMFGKAVAEAAEEGVVEVEMVEGPGLATVTLTYATPPGGEPSAYDVDAAAGNARALGGRLELTRQGARVALALSLPSGEDG